MQIVVSTGNGSFRYDSAPEEIPPAVFDPTVCELLQGVLAMIDLHYWTTPNGHKITMFLEETGSAV